MKFRGKAGAKSVLTLGDKISLRWSKARAVCVYQFKVVLRGVSPMVWRRILLRSDQSIADLHYSLQIVMGWSDSHLNRFHIHGKDYGVAHEGGIWFDPSRGCLSLPAKRNENPQSAERPAQ